MSEVISALLPQLGSLDEGARTFVTGSFVAREYPFGAVIAREGEPADAFYLIASGEAREIKRGLQGQEVSLGKLGPGDSFGLEGVLGEGSRHAATVRASSRVEVFRLERSVLTALFRQHPEVEHLFELQHRRRITWGFLSQWTPFGRLPRAGVDELLSGLREAQYAPGELVVRDGDRYGPLYIVRSGRLRAWRQEGGEPVPVAWLRQGDFFGESQLLRGALPSSMDLDDDGDIDVNVEALSPCALLVLDSELLESVIRAHPEVVDGLRDRAARHDYASVSRAPLDFQRELLPADTGAPPPRAEPEGEGGPEGPFASEGGHFVKRSGRIRRFPFVHQLDEMDCGAACVAMICRHFGRAVSLARIRALLQVSAEGTSLRAIVRGARDLGLAARSVKASLSNLDQLPLPAVVHWQGNHWVVLYDVRREEVRVADPARGLRELPRGDFEESWSGYAALFDYTEAFEGAPEGGARLSWFLPFLRPHVGILGQTLLLALLISGLEMVLPLFTQVLVDRVLVESDYGLLNLLLLGMGAVLVFSVIALLIQRYLMSWVVLQVDTSSLDALTRRLLELPLSYFTARRTGDIQRQLGNMRELRAFLLSTLMGSITAVMQLLAAVALMLIYSPVLFATWLATLPLYFGLMITSGRWLRPMFDDLEEARSRYQSRQVDAIRGMETVKALSAEAALRDKLLGEFIGLGRKQFESDLIVRVYKGTLRMVGFLGTALFLYVGGRQVMAGALTLGELMAFQALSGMASAPLMTLLNLWDQAQLSSVMLDRLNDVVQAEPEQGPERASLAPVRSLGGQVRLEGVSFRYGGPESPLILQDISLEVPAGSTVALVGRSGSGKTTLVKCLAGLLEPTEGAVYFDGVDHRTVRFPELRRHIGFVLQGTYLFDDTIAGNIALGDEEPDMDRVMQAARAANAHTFIERLPLGYQARVGESGLAISGGQRQRIAIARALYRRPSILVLDEATSALDTDSERAVQENLEQLLVGRTAFVIAHRLSTIRGADRIVVLEEGRVAEQGTHDQLMEARGLYHYLCSRQLNL